ncbi:MAG: hypothetical protein NVS9B3_15310 [Gemmatimonadaceae bacterium]
MVPSPPEAAEPGDATYDPAELRALRAAYTGGERPLCPRDATPMTARAVGGGSFGLGYARRREWLICPRCRRSALFDLKRGTRN